MQPIAWMGSGLIWLPVHCQSLSLANGCGVEWSYVAGVTCQRRLEAMSGHSVAMEACHQSDPRHWCATEHAGLRADA